MIFNKDIAFLIYLELSGLLLYILCLLNVRTCVYSDIVLALCNDL